MKKLLLSIISLTLLPYKIIAMKSGTCSTDLLLHKKPENIATYQWSKQRARKLVEQKKEAVLNMLGIINKDAWEEEKNRLKSEFSYKISVLHKKRISEFQKQRINKFDKEFQNELINALQNLKSKDLVIIPNSNDEIVFRIKVENTTKKIRIIPSNQTPKCCGGMWTAGNIIFVNKNMCHENGIIGKELTATLGHELGHIIAGHIQKYFECKDETTCILLEFLNKLQTTKSSFFIKQFFRAYFEFIKAQETEADIIGLFNIEKIAHNRKNYFNNISSMDNINIHEYLIDKLGKEEENLCIFLTSKLGKDFICADPEHPCSENSAQYFSEIHDSMRMDFDTEGYLKLGEKPKNVRVQVWCEKQAEKTTQKALKNVLNILEISKEEFERKKKNFHLNDCDKQNDKDNFICKRCKYLLEAKELPFDKEFHNKLESVLITLKEKTGIIKNISIKYRIIRVTLENGEEIKFLNSPYENFIGLGICNQNNIFICPEAYKKDDKLTKKALEGIIGFLIVSIIKKFDYEIDLLIKEFSKKNDGKYAKIIKEFDRQNTMLALAVKSVKNFDLESLTEALNKGHEYTPEIEKKLEKIDSFSYKFETAIEKLYISQIAQAHVIGAFGDPEVLLALKKHVAEFFAEDDVDDCSSDCESCCNSKSESSFDSNSCCNCEFCIDDIENLKLSKKCCLPHLYLKVPGYETLTAGLEQVYKAIIEEEINSDATKENRTRENKTKKIGSQIIQELKLSKLKKSTKF